jgi:hypothetical protein
MLCFQHGEPGGQTNTERRENDVKRNGEAKLQPREKKC